MKKIISVLILLIGLWLNAAAQKAELHVENNSGRTLTIKVMNDAAAADSKYSEMIIQPYSKDAEYFSQTGNYYLKSKAEKPGEETIYKKGNPFKVYVGNNGYSVLTITYTITESLTKNPMEGKSISQNEFEKDN